VVDERVTIDKRKSPFPATEPTMSIHLVLSFENHRSLSVLSALAVIGVEEVKVQIKSFGRRNAYT